MKNMIFPVVYLSASSDAETLTKVVGTNPSAYVIKPFNIRELNMVIELAIFKDRKEKELQKLNNELEEKVRQRTKDLAEANKELTRALEKEREIGELKVKDCVECFPWIQNPADLYSQLSTIAAAIRRKGPSFQTKNR
jgi:AmiR/NasT family two-component response regulator